MAARFERKEGVTTDLFSIEDVVTHLYPLGTRLFRGFGFLVPEARQVELIEIEPTETESKERMDDFIEAMIKIKKEAEIDPNLVKTAPHYAPSKRLDAVSAARNPQLKWCNLN